MKPDELIKYIFEEERQDYQARTLKCRKAGLVQARQRAMYLLKFFYPQMIWEEIGQMFGQKHDGAIHAYTKVTNYIATEKRYEKEMAKYIAVLRNRITNKMKVNCVSVEYKMTNKRAILHKSDEGWIILLKRLNGRKVEKKHLALSDEALQGIIESYQILK
jgi:hypothetical protein